MTRARFTLLILLLGLLVPLNTTGQAPTNHFVNFETAPVHPVDISSDGRLLAVSNLPDNRVEIFDLQVDPPNLVSTIFVGLDPTTVRFRTPNELWVVNHISDSINVIDVARQSVIRIINTLDGPTDLVFARGKAFVSCTPVNTVQVFDQITGALERSIPIDAERPKALAVSPDQTKVYAAILESGNRTTILAPRFTRLAHVPSAGPADYPESPHAGINPAPNSGTNFFPIINTNIPAGQLPPRVSIIVKKMDDGRWRDDNNGDWTDYVSGDKAPFSGRVPGWDILDHDIASIDSSTFEVSYIDSLMNIGMSLAVNPQSGAIALAGTDALNHLRFEPVIQSVFLRVNLALVEPVTATKRLIDLNFHLDYKTRTLPAAERKPTLSEPRGLAWSDDGERLYITGMGSDNLIAVDKSGIRIGSVLELPSGPVGLAYDATRKRLYVLNRFASSLSVVETATMQVKHTLPIHDPTPERINLGRQHFYNTHKTSGLGLVSCASCHIDGRFDRLAWDLGSMSADMKFFKTNSHNFANNPPARTNHFHPMKGPMTTQTLQDIIGHEPFHWRGDRDGIEEFNPTFKDLQGNEKELSEVEMQEFEDFLASLHFPPNRFRNFDNSLPVRVPLPGHRALGRGVLKKGSQLPDGDARAGFSFFRNRSQGACMVCHTTPAGHGTDQQFLNGLWEPLELGPQGEHHKAMAALERSEELPFKIAQLRNLPDKVGFDLASNNSRSGFGFFHDGRVDSLTRFLQDGFNIFNDQNTANIIAFLLAFSGSDISVPPSNDINNPPGDFSRDAAAAAGRQLLVAGPSTQYNEYLTRAMTANSRLELILKGKVNNEGRGFLFDRISGQFLADRAKERFTQEQILTLASQSPFLTMLVPEGTGRRIGLDRDSDGVFDSDEIDAGSNPLQKSPPQNPSFRLAGISRDGSTVTLRWNSLPGRNYIIESCRDLGDWRAFGNPIQSTSNDLTHIVDAGGDLTQRFFRVRILQ